MATTKHRVRTAPNMAHDADFRAQNFGHCARGKRRKDNIVAKTDENNLRSPVHALSSRTLFLGNGLGEILESLAALEFGILDYARVGIAREITSPCDEGLSLVRT